MSNQLERARDEIRDTLAFGGDVPSMKALVPVISALNKKNQEIALLMVVEGLRVDLVRALESVEWKMSNWKFAVVHHAAHLGCIDIVADMASEVDSLSLQYCLAAAAKNSTRGQMETVRILAPMVHTAKRPMVHAIRDALLSVHYGQQKTKPERKQAVMAVLGELFCYERVDRFLNFALKVEGPDRTAKMLPCLVDFLAENLQNPEFVHNQASKRPMKPGLWSEVLPTLSSECAGALMALQAAGDAQRLDARVDQAQADHRTRSTRTPAPRF